MDLEKFLQNPKTAYLAGEYKRLESQMTETQKMLDGDPAMAELAKEGFYMIDPGVWLADFGEPLQFRYAVIEDGRVTVVQGDMGEASGG